jgi:hypothetical protein
MLFTPLSHGRVKILDIMENHGQYYLELWLQYDQMHAV